MNFPEINSGEALVTINIPSNYKTFFILLLCSVGFVHNPNKRLWRDGENCLATNVTITGFAETGKLATALVNVLILNPLRPMGFPQMGMHVSGGV